jgi:addiction module HigA family antidote
MLPGQRVTMHPGEVLLKEFLEPLGLTQARLARAIGVPQNRVNELVRGKRGITPETALLLSEYFRNSAEFWMNLQSAHDLTKARMQRKPSASLRGRPKVRDRAGSASAD